MIFDLNGGDRNGKKVVRLALYAATAFNTFLALFGAPGRPLKWPKATFNINFPTFPI
jgi:hypothetical protein